MAQKIQIICDRCGAEIINATNSSQMTFWGLGEPRSEIGKRIDLCFDCHIRFIKFLKEGSKMV